MSTGSGHVPFIWSIAELLRGHYKQSEYRLVVLPLTLLRRLDQVLEPTKDKVLAEAAKREGKGLDLDRILKKAASQDFYNTSKHTLATAHSDAENVGLHLREYIAHFDPAVREIFDAFEFEAQLKRLEKAGLLYLVLGKFLDVDLDPEKVPPAVMGDIYEELIRRFSEISNETAGEHFTPREVVRLCAELVLIGDKELAKTPGVVRSVYDPACGTGGMLSVTDELVRERNANAELVLFGQEMNPESWAVCRAEMLLKGQDPSRIAPGSTLSADGHADGRFDYQLANPPFGVDWSADHEAVTDEHEKQGMNGRFGAGTPRKSDGALLFLQNMLAKMKPPEQDNGTRIAIIFNGSPLFSGGAGSGESEIRRWILENDWLEAIVALPEQLFYNTGIATYIWVLTSNKEKRRKGKVQLIDAREWWEPMPKSLGDKRRRLGEEHIERVLKEWKGFAEDTDHSKVRENEFFGYRRITVERPLRLRYRVDEKATEGLEASPAFQKLIVPKKNSKDPDADITAGESAQKALLEGLRQLNGFETTDRDEAEKKLSEIFKTAGKLSAPAKKAVWAAVSETDAEAPASDSKGEGLEPDPDLRDHEVVPLAVTAEDFFATEVRPFAPDAWMAETEPKVGYEIPFFRLFYRYEPPRSLTEIDEELASADQEIQRLIEDLGS